MIEHIAGERLPAGPGEGPEGWRKAHLAEFLLRLLPERGRLVGDMEGDFRRMRHRAQTCLGEDEGLSIRDGAGRAHRSIVRCR